MRFLAFLNIFFINPRIHHQEIDNKLILELDGVDEDGLVFFLYLFYVLFLGVSVGFDMLVQG